MIQETHNMALVMGNARGPHSLQFIVFLQSKTLIYCELIMYRKETVSCGSEGLGMRENIKLKTVELSAVQVCDNDPAPPLPPESLS
ncbi:hypothetical protein E2C01_066190 [Portunus trituberculatus]|uniref:Uncharacterized protein n=1 Tax=Portunus trituberculatus TaxID=210409 RepID=A0A5B7HQA1_PORTR|nr:hypothetical protein [Portunus trituberculatus]